MKNHIIILSLALIAIVCSCNQQHAPVVQDPAFSSYVSAFTSGVIGTKNSIRIRFTSELSPSDSVRVIEDRKLVKFKPSLEGELKWIDATTLEFTPSAPLPPGQVFTATLSFDKLAQVPEELSDFEFDFRVADQHLSCEVLAISPYNAEEMIWHFAEGVIRTSDYALDEFVELTLAAQIGSKALDIDWSHSSDGKSHTFTIDSLQRINDAQQIQLMWDGAKISSEDRGMLEETLPALGDFLVLDHRVEQQPDQKIIVRFSDPIKTDQNLDGLVRLSNGVGTTTSVEVNELHIYPRSKIAGAFDVQLDASIKNRLDYRLGEEFTIPIVFEQIKPNVRLIHEKGTILPSSNQMRFPFEAVNLSAVDVRIIQLFTNNIPQFMQVNELDQTREMKRVGRLVRKKTVTLNPEGNRDLSVWQDFHLDLSELIEPDPGSIYRVEIGFRKEYSMWDCGDVDDEIGEMEETEEWDEYAEDESSYWDYFDDYYYDYGYWGSYYYGSGYVYSERENPCHKSYYMRKKPVGRNILASDLGVIVKTGNDGNMTVAVSNLISTLPIEGVRVEVINYQQQHLADARTNASGLATINGLNKKPFLLIATYKGQKSYVKLDQASTLSVSKFDVSGDGVRKGIKGFIYGERGVWRPGDDIFLSFMLEEQNEQLPVGHPIKYELTNAKGQVVDRQVKPLSDDGLLCFASETNPEAPTGNWTAQIRAGGAVFTKNIKVETIKPNRLRIKVGFDKEFISAKDKEAQGNVEVAWLHGAPARNLRTQITAKLAPVRTKFKTHTDFIFDDLVRKFHGQEKVIFDQKVDNKGKADIELNVELENRAPGKLKAYLQTKAYEEGGEFSIDRFSIDYSPYNTYVGLKMPKGDASRRMLLTDQDHYIDLVTLDAEGNPVACDSLEVQLYEISWRWWWDSQRDNLSRFETGEGVVPYISGFASTGTDGNGKFKFRVDYPEWGRFLVRVIDRKGGHATSSTFYIDWPGWAGRAQKENPGGESMLVFSSDKAKYEVGETCTLTFPSSNVGRALISLEDGSGVIEAHWVQAKKDQTSWSFKVTEEMAPTVYAAITLVQPHSQTLNDLPIRMYGVIPIAVENPKTHIKPIIATADHFEPEENYVVSVSESSGRGMSYTLAIVDEGLLDLTRFPTPDPWNHFYAREALGVRTWDVYDDVIGAFQTDASKLLGIGGGGELDKKGKNKANRFKPVVEFAGPFTLEPGKTAKHEFEMPNYVGSVRVMVVAKQDDAYGSAEKAVPVKKPLMVLATAPRVIGPDEDFKLPVTVFAMEDHVKNVAVKIKTSSNIEIVESAAKELTFHSQGDQIVNFNLKALPTLGIATIQVEVKSGHESAHHEIELDIRNPNPPKTQVINQYVDAGESWDVDFDLPGMMGTNQVSLEISSIPPIDLGRRLNYLIGYPHGCVEQTTSRAFPQLFLPEIVDMSDHQKLRARQNVQIAVDRLASFQNSNGGLSYWPGQGHVSDWGTSYAGHFLIVAKDEGYQVSQHMINNWVKYQKEVSRNWRPQSSKNYRSYDLMQAYRLYTLALAGEPLLSQMNRIRQVDDLHPQAKWILAGAYAQAGKHDIAKGMVEKLTTVVEEYTELGYSYGSDTRDMAMMVQTLVKLDDRETAAQLVKSLSKRLNSASWYSTQTTAFALMAISDFSQNALSESMRVDYAHNSQSVSNVTTTRSIVVRDLQADQLNDNKLEVSNKGKGGLFVRIIAQGTPIVGDLEASQNNLAMTVTYQDLNGKPIDVSNLTQGTDFKAIVTLRHPGHNREYREMALTQIIPSGWEIHNTRMDQSASVHALDIPQYADIRDDRVHKYFTMSRHRQSQFVLLLHASYQGRFYLPAVQCEAMYDNTIFARTAGRWVNVEAPKTDDRLSHNK